jgi:tetratricopeptide (TPR) repeat protein
MRSLGSYHYGMYRWDDYLLDIQGAVETGTKRQVAASEEIAEEIRDQTAQIQGIRQDLLDLRDDIQWGFNLIADKMDRQIELFSRAVKELEAIRKALDSPLMKQARELFRWGEERYRKGLFDKALDAFLQSEQKYEVDCVLQLHIGTLFLEGRNEECNVIDLNKAETHLLLAARFARADRNALSNWQEICGKAFYRAGIAAYLIGEQHEKNQDSEGRQKSLERAIAHFAKAIQLLPGFTRTLYSQSKCYALLSRREPIIEAFAALSDRDRRYCAEVLSDDDFADFRGDIEGIFASAIRNPGPLARAASDRLSQSMDSLGWAKRTNPETQEIVSKISDIEAYLNAVPRLLQGLDVDLEDLNTRLSETWSALDGISESILTGRVNFFQSEIDAVASRKSGCEYQIKSLEEKMKRTEVGGWGCLLALIVVFGVPAFFAILMQLLPSLLPSLEFLLVVGWLVCGFGGAWIVRSAKKKPLRDEVGEMRKTIAECDRQIPSLNRQLEEVKNQLADFVAWKQMRSLT